MCTQGLSISKPGVHCAIISLELKSTLYERPVKLSLQRFPRWKQLHERSQPGMTSGRMTQLIES